MELVHILCFLLLPLRLAAAVKESACAVRGDCGPSESVRSNGISMLQKTVANGWSSMNSSRGVKAAHTRSHAADKDKQRRSASINSKDYGEVMSKVIHRYKGAPAEGNKKLWGHKAFECRMPKCRRAGCEDFHADCCNAQMARMLSDVANFLQRKGHKFAPTFGTLLGAKRDQAVIPWTADVDISLGKDGVDALLNQQEIPYRFFRPPGDAVVRGCPYYEHGERRYWAGGDISSLHYDHQHTVFFYMDLYEDGSTWDMTKFPSCIRAADASAKMEVWVYNLRLPPVRDAGKCLRSAYGRDWAVPKHDDWGDRVALVQADTHLHLGLNSTTGASEKVASA